MTELYGMVRWRLSPYPIIQIDRERAMAVCWNGQHGFRAFDLNLCKEVAQWHVDELPTADEALEIIALAINSGDYTELIDPELYGRRSRRWKDIRSSM